MAEDIIEILKHDGVGIFPTDTIYGLVGSANSAKAVERIYFIKERDKNKSLIILISSIEDLKDFGIVVSDKAKIFMQKFWPGKVSIIFNFNNKKLSYLDKTASGTLAFRLPDKKDLIELLKITGPLVAPSANVQGVSPVKNIEEAKKYFGDMVDFYIDGGTLISEPSTLVKISDDKTEVLREGAVKIQ